MLAQAPILILDEATSSLDSVTERYIQDSLEKMMQNRTTIVIAHRLSTLAKMDRILVFDRGKVVEEGTHTQLMARGGHYSRLWQMQAGGFLPDVPIDFHENIYIPVKYKYAIKKIFNKMRLMNAKIFRYFLTAMISWTSIGFAMSDPVQQLLSRL